jgi:hypothetical protein
MLRKFDVVRDAHRDKGKTKLILGVGRPASGSDPLKAFGHRLRVVLFARLLR